MTEHIALGEVAVDYDVVGTGDPVVLVHARPSAAGFATLEEVMTMIAPMMDAYRSDGRAVAMELFLTAVAGTGSREQLDRLVPGAFDEAVADADQFFHVELPAVARWSFGPQDAGRIDRPVLNVVGGDATPRYIRTSEIVQELLPHADRFALPGAGHLLMAQNPEAMAERLDQFWRTS